MFAIKLPLCLLACLSTQHQEKAISSGKTVLRIAVKAGDNFDDEHIISATMTVFDMTTTNMIWKGDVANWRQIGRILADRLIGSFSCDNRLLVVQKLFDCRTV